MRRLLHRRYIAFQFVNKYSGFHRTRLWCKIYIEVLRDITQIHLEAILLATITEPASIKICIVHVVISQVFLYFRIFNIKVRLKEEV